MDIKLYKSPWRAVKLMLLCSIFVVIGVVILNTPDAPHWAGWLNVLFFGLGYPVGLFQLLDRRPQIIINEIGIFDRMAYKDFINWEVISGAYLVDVHGQKFICLIVDEKYEPSIKIKNFQKTLSKQLGFQELNIALGQIKINEVKMTEFILTMINARPESRKDKLKDRLFR